MPVKLPMISTGVCPKRWNWASLRRTTACPRVRWAEDGSMPSLTRRGRPSPSRSARTSRGCSSATPEVSTCSCSSTGALGVDTAATLQHKRSAPATNASTGGNEAGPADADVHLAMCDAATTPATAEPGAVDNRRPPVRRWATLPIRGPRNRRVGLRRARGRVPGGPGRFGWARVVAGVTAGVLGLAGCVSVRPLELVPADRVAQTSLVLDAGGRRLAALHGPEDRTAVSLEKVSRWMRVAVVDTEDARFWGHGGVDWLAVARAAARDLEHGRVVEGGSTITQQYVKNTYVTGERTLRRKLAEAGHAWGLERRNGKQAILEAYLNTVYFGQGAYGVEAAAQTFFSTRAARLTLTQAALLAGMIRAPSAYDPFRHPRAARARRAAVLARLERHGHLSSGCGRRRRPWACGRAARSAPRRPPATPGRARAGRARPTAPGAGRRWPGPRFP